MKNRHSSHRKFVVLPCALLALMWVTSWPTYGAQDDAEKRADEKPVVAVEADKTSTAPDPANLKSFERLSAPQAVREGNRLLLDGQTAEALRAYDQAAKRRPDRREVDFVKGLAHYRMGALDEARQDFDKAALADDPSLVDDAVYARAACDHAAAFAPDGKPQEALQHLEDAMTRYRQVLTNNPDHVMAQEANRKAATSWRQIKTALQQQPPPEKNQQSDQNEKNQEEQSEDQQQQSGEQKQDQQSQDQQSNQQQQSDQQKEQQSAQQQQSEQSQEKQQAGEQDQEKKEETSAAKQDQEEKEPEQSKEANEAAPKEKEEDANERDAQQQAASKLRSWMESHRDRQRNRREASPIKPAPVAKDW